MGVLRDVVRRPAATYRVLVTVLVVAYLVSAIGASDTPSDGALYYVGAGGWAVFLVTLVLTVTFSIALLITKLRRPEPVEEAP